MLRIDKRKNTQLRQVKIYPYYLDHPHGSALIEMGKTKVICTAMIEESVPKFLRGKGCGWLTAEYGMLPAATQERNVRDIARIKPDGRALEIQRLIGRTLRTVVDLEALGERTIWVDCDVLQADGGTRTAAITAGFVAIMLAMKQLQRKGYIREIPMKEYLAAVSIGIIEGNIMVDLCYDEDSRADVDMNVVMTESGKFVEIQGSAEKKPFKMMELNKMLSLAEDAIKKLIQMQKKVLES